MGLELKHRSNADPIRRIFKTAFEAVDLPYFNPHSLRNLLVRLGDERCRSPEDFKAWSQNLGHEQVLTTFTSYGPWILAGKLTSSNPCGMRRTSQPHRLTNILQRRPQENCSKPA